MAVFRESGPNRASNTGKPTREVLANPAVSTRAPITLVPPAQGAAHQAEAGVGQKHQEPGHGYRHQKVGVNPGLHQGEGNVMDDQGGKGDVYHEHVQGLDASGVQLTVFAQKKTGQHAHGQGNQLGHGETFAIREGMRGQPNHGPPAANGPQASSWPLRRPRPGTTPATGRRSGYDLAPGLACCFGNSSRSAPRLNSPRQNQELKRRRLRWNRFFPKKTDRKHAKRVYSLPAYLTKKI